jgi:hypothetical protein
MAESLFRGPLISIGSLMDGRVETFDGPEIAYQGTMIPDVRFSPANKDTNLPAQVRGAFHSPDFISVDTTPSANSTTTVAAAQAPSTTAGVALSLTTAVLGTAAGVPVWAPGVPILPFNASTVVTVSAIDFGFQTGTTVANSSTVVVVDNSYFDVGQWIVIAGAGAAGATNVPLITQVQSVSTNTTVITILPAALTALSNAPIGEGNLHGGTLLPPATQFGPGVASSTYTLPYRGAGFGLTFDPLQGSCRALSVTAASVGSGTTTILVSGYDIYGVPMTNAITANGTTTVNGTKAFKYISSIVSSGTAATTGTPASISVGISDVFGLNYRSDKWEYLTILWNGCDTPTSAGWTAALASTSTATTIDVRGTVNASTLAVVNAASTNGVRRLVIIQNIPLQNMIKATPLNVVPLFGTNQV